MTESLFSLLFIPGLAGNSVMWRGQIEGLREFHPQVTDVHMRCGSIGEMAASLLAEHAGELVLCGASMGGMIAMEATRQAPDRIKGLALLGTVASPETDDMRALREAAIELFAQERLAEVIEPNVDFAFHPDTSSDTALVQSYLDFVYEAGGEQLIRQNRAVIERPDARLHLPHVRCPVLVMCGEQDQLTPIACSREIVSLVPQAEWVVVPKCGHMLTMEQPAFVNATLRRWLESVGGTSAGAADSTSVPRP